MTIQQAASALYKSLMNHPKFFSVQISPDEKHLVVYMRSEPDVPLFKSFQDYPVVLEILPIEEHPLPDLPPLPAFKPSKPGPAWIEPKDEK